jgi:hypothetical protein
MIVPDVNPGWIIEDATTRYNFREGRRWMVSYAG